MRKAILLAAMIALILAVGAGTAFAALIQGTPRDDRLTGTEVRDTILGYKGDDLLRGLGGTDTLQGGGGDDTIFGGPGADVLRGRGGNDRLHGGEDPTDPKHTDEFYCGAGFDTVYLEEGEHSVHDRTVKACEEIVNEKTND
jgi:Ca2+-binding RTX toxin-like protein